MEDFVDELVSRYDLKAPRRIGDRPGHRGRVALGVAEKGFVAGRVACGEIIGVEEALFYARHIRRSLLRPSQSVVAPRAKVQALTSIGRRLRIEDQDALRKRPLSSTCRVILTGLLAPNGVGPHGDRKQRPGGHRRKVDRVNLLVREGGGTESVERRFGSIGRVGAC